MGRSYIRPSRCFWAYAKAFRFWSVSCAPLSPQGGHGFQILALLGLQIGVVHGFNSANHVLGSSLQLLQGCLEGGGVYARFSHEGFIHSRENAVILGGEIQIEGRSLIDVHGQGAVIPGC